MPTRLPGPGGPSGPLATRDHLAGGTIRDLALLANPRARVDFWEEFDFAPEIQEHLIPLYDATNAATIATTGTSRGIGIIPRGGLLVGADFLGEDALEASDEGYLTFSVTNRGSGLASNVMLAETAANTTKATGGAAVEAKALLPLTLAETPATLYVGTGDVIEATVAVTGELANAVKLPVVRLRIRVVPVASRLVPLSPSGGGADQWCLVAPVADSATGEVAITLGAVDGSLVAGLYAGDHLCVRGDSGFILQCRFKVSGVSSVQRFVAGLASTFEPVLDNTAKNVWLRCDGSLLAKIEADDGTNNTDDQETPVTLAADTWYWLTINAQRLPEVRFYLNESTVGEVSLAALGSSLLQPAFILQKSSGAGTPTLTVDCLRVWRTREE